MGITLDKLPIGNSGKVIKVNGVSDSISRLMEMGLVTGSRVRVEKISPFGCPMAIRLKGTYIAIRRDDARKVRVVPDPVTN
jgi:ferrous iron transport protein A